MAGHQSQQPLKTHRAMTIQTMRVMGFIEFGKSDRLLTSMFNNLSSLAKSVGRVHMNRSNFPPTKNGFRTTSPHWSPFPGAGHSDPRFCCS